MAINLSSVPLEDAVYSAFGKGLNYAVSQALLLIEDVVSDVGKGTGSMTDEAA
jgi:hypothetical protein